MTSAFAKVALLDFGFATTVKDHVLTLAHEHETFIVPIVFLLGFAESIVLVSLFVPSSILFLAIGAIHQAIGGAFAPIWLAGAVGASLGDLVSYAMGRRYRHHIADIWPFSRNPRLLSRARAMDRRWGAPAMILSKYLGMMRPLAPVMAGTIRMPFTRFIAASAIGALLWSATFIGPGYGLSLLGR